VRRSLPHLPSALVAPILLLASIALGVPASAAAQMRPMPPTGPAVPDFGPVFEVPGLEMETPTDMDYRVLFDVAGGSPEAGDLNQELNSVARFVNMQVKAGVPLERLHVAVVVHGTAGRDLLLEDAFRARYEVENPNAEMIRQLAAAGVEIYMCGQSAAARGLAPEELVPDVTMALSAMTVRAVLQSDGYEVIR
jgi:intracellular sulfur oxidation DsrE/DsrF family protein